MQNKKLIILIVLGIGAIFSLIYGITAPLKGKRKAPSKGVVIHRSERMQSRERTVPAIRNAAKTHFVTWVRNPFFPKTPLTPSASATSPSSTTALATPGLTLDGIMWDAENPRAMINGSLVGIGDKIYGNKVIDIKEDRVILNDGTEDFVLRLGR